MSFKDDYEILLDFDFYILLVNNWLIFWIEFRECKN